MMSAIVTLVTLISRYLFESAIAVTTLIGYLQLFVLCGKHRCRFLLLLERLVELRGSVFQLLLLLTVHVAVQVSHLHLQPLDLKVLDRDETYVRTHGVICRSHSTFRIFTFTGRIKRAWW